MPVFSFFGFFYGSLENLLGTFPINGFRGSDLDERSTKGQGVGSYLADRSAAAFAQSPGWSLVSGNEG